MALGDDYVTTQELKDYYGDKVTGTDYDTNWPFAIGAASRLIDRYCGRQFNLDSDTSNARIYYPCDQRMVELGDDIANSDFVVVATDTSDDGTFNQSWTSTDWQLEPLDGVVAGTTGWPFREIRAVESLLFPVSGQRPSVQVTAQWGWAAVPDPVKEACFIQARRFFSRKDSPLGVAGFNEFGAIRLAGDLDRDVTVLLERYRTGHVLIG